VLSKLSILLLPTLATFCVLQQSSISTSYNPLLLTLMTVQGNTLVLQCWAITSSSLFEGDSTSLSLKLPSHSKGALCPSAMSKTECSAFYQHRSMAKLRLSKGWRLSTKISLEFTKLGIPSQVFYIRFSHSSLLIHRWPIESRGHWWPAWPIGILVLWYGVASSVLRLHSAATGWIWLLWW
jgi:hypothetical protein